MITVALKLAPYFLLPDNQRWKVRIGGVRPTLLILTVRTVKKNINEWIKDFILHLSWDDAVILRKERAIITIWEEIKVKELEKIYWVSR